MLAFRIFYLPSTAAKTILKLHSIKKKTNLNIHSLSITQKTPPENKYLERFGSSKNSSIYS